MLLSKFVVPGAVKGIALAGVIAATLAGCGTSPPTRYYTPLAVAPTVAARYAGPPLQVRAVHVPATWDRIELVREVSPGQLQVREFDQWAAPLGRIAQQTLTQDLALRLRPGAVLYPQAARGSDAVELTVDILSLHIDGREAVMQVGWSVRSAASPDWRSSTLTLSVATAGETGDATAQAVSELLGQLADAVAAGLLSGATNSPAPAP